MSFLSPNQQSQSTDGNMKHCLSSLASSLLHPSSDCWETQCCCLYAISRTPSPVCGCVNNKLAESLDDARQAPVSATDAWWTDDQLWRLPDGRCSVKWEEQVRTSCTFSTIVLWCSCVASSCWIGIIVKMLLWIISYLDHHSPTAKQPLQMWFFFVQLCSSWQNFNWQSVTLSLCNSRAFS